MNKEITLKEYNHLEYLGDAVYNFAARMELCGESPDREVRSIARYIQCNDFMAAIGIHLKLVPHKDYFKENDPYGYRSPYPYADALEVEFYKLFKEGGYDKVSLYFRNNIKPHCKTLRSAMAFAENKIVPTVEKSIS